MGTVVSKPRLPRKCSPTLCSPPPLIRFIYQFPINNHYLYFTKPEQVNPFKVSGFEDHPPFVHAIDFRASALPAVLRLVNAAGTPVANPPWRAHPVGRWDQRSYRRFFFDSPDSEKLLRSTLMICGSETKGSEVRFESPTPWRGMHAPPVSFERGARTRTTISQLRLRSAGCVSAGGEVRTPPPFFGALLLHFKLRPESSYTRWCGGVIIQRESVMVNVVHFDFRDCRRLPAVISETCQRMIPKDDHLS